MKIPIFVEDSIVPKLVSYVSPIEPYAVSFGIWVWCRGKFTKTLKTHEHIHYEQQVWMLFVFQWIAYILLWCALFIKYRDGVKAYRQNPFELEAYENQGNENYITERGKYGWKSYVKKAFEG